VKHLCEMCGRIVSRPEITFRMKIELFADPAPPDITEEDLERDFKEEMRRLIEQLESVDVREAEEEVYESYLFTLCGGCRKRAHRWLRDHHLPFEDLG